MITFKDLMFENIDVPYMSGISTRVFFQNGYGASIVKSEFSYGGSDGLYELAVLKNDEDVWGITYETPITNDVMGYLSEDEVTKILKEIQQL